MSALLRFLTSERSRDHIERQVAQLHRDLQSEFDRSSIWDEKKDDTRLTEQQRIRLAAALDRRQTTLHEARSIEDSIGGDRNKFGVLGKGSRVRRQIEDLRCRIESLRGQATLFMDIVPDLAHASAATKADSPGHLHLISHDAGVIELDIDDHRYRDNNLRVEAMGRSEVRLRGSNRQSLGSTASAPGAASVVETLDSEDKSASPPTYRSKQSTADWVRDVRPGQIQSVPARSEDVLLTSEQSHAPQDMIPLAPSSQVEPNEYLSNAIRTTSAATSALTPQQQMGLALGTLIPAGLYGIGSAGIAEHARRVASRAAHAAERSAAAAEAQKDIAVQKEVREQELHEATMLKIALERQKLELEIAEKLNNTRSSTPGNDGGKDEGYDSGDTDTPPPPPDTRDDSHSEDDVRGPASQPPHPSLLASALKQRRHDEDDKNSPANNAPEPPSLTAPQEPAKQDKGKAPMRELTAASSLPILPSPPSNKPAGNHEVIEMLSLKSDIRQMVPA